MCISVLHFTKLAAETLSIGANVRYSVSFRWPSQRFRSRKSLATLSFWNSCLPQGPMDPMRRHRDLTSCMILHCAHIVHILCCHLEMCTGEYTFSPFPAHCKAVVKHHAHNAKVAQHTLTVTNPSAQSSHAKSPLPLACFRNSPILLLLLYSAQATVSLSK